MGTGVLLDSQVETSKLEFRLKLLKDEIATQASTFDQIDSKTGVALGFTFIVVGQVLASVFRIATDQSKLSSAHPVVTSAGFWLASLFAVAAIVCGLVSRWPRDFQNAIGFTCEQLAGTYEDMLRGAISDFGHATEWNDKKIASKSKWATRTYLFVGLALISYLGLTIVLYVYAVPKK